jgi:hypothetical protein
MARRGEIVEVNREKQNLASECNCYINEKYESEKIMSKLTTKKVKFCEKFETKSDIEVYIFNRRKKAKSVPSVRFILTGCGIKVGKKLSGSFEKSRS